MRNIREIILFIIVAFFSAALLVTCNFLPRHASQDSEVSLQGRGPVIRYVNLNILFEFLAGKDANTKKKQIRKKSLIKSADKIRELLLLADEDNQGELLVRQDDVKRKIEEIKSEEEHRKEKILNFIDRTLRSIAVKRNIDFILNMGEGAVFAKKEYDITGDVLREIMNHRKRNAPVSR